MALLYAGMYGPEVIVDLNGKAQPGLPITVYLAGTTTLATLYADRTMLNGTVGNPINTDAYGNLSFFAVPGRYSLLVRGVTNPVYVYEDPSDVTSGDAVASFNTRVGAVTLQPSDLTALTTMLAPGSAHIVVGGTTLAPTVDLLAADKATLAAMVNDALVLHLAGAETVTGVKTFSANPVLNVGALPEAAVINLVADLASKAVDTLVMHLGGVETVLGIKTFTANPVLNAGALPESAITNLVTDLAAKATDSLAVHLAGAETVTGVKTFTTNPVLNAGALPESAVVNLVADLAARALATDVAAKATDTLVTHLAGAETVTGVKTFTANPVLNAGALPEGAIANLVADLAARALDSLAVHLAGAETVTGVKTFTTNPVLNAGAIPESAVVSLVTDLTARALDAAVLHLAGAETITGAKTFSVNPVLNAGAIPEAAVSNLVADLALRAPLAAPTFTGHVTVPTATLGSDAATLAQVQALQAGVSIAQSPAQAVSLVNQALTGLPNIGGYQTIAADRVLLTAQTVSSQNGVWVTATGAWTRPTDFATGSNAAGKLVEVEDGSVWLLPSLTAVTVDTTGEVWQRFDVSALTFTAPLVKTGSNVAATFGISPATFAQGNDVRFQGSPAGTASAALAATDPVTTNSRVPTGGATGDLTGSYPAPTLIPTGPGVTGPLGSATTVPVVTIDAKGRTTALTSTAIAIPESAVTNLVADLGSKVVSVAAGTGIAVTGTAVAPIVGVTALLALILGWYNVKDPVYGAKGDGVTDDTAAFVAVRQAAPAGSVIYIPPGVYIVGDPAFYLNVSGITYKGAGKDQTTIKAKAGGTIFVQLTSTPLANIAVEDMTFDGAGIVQSCFFLANLSMTGFRVSRCRIINISGYGFGGNGLSNVVIEDNIFDGQGAPAMTAVQAGVASRDWVIRRNRFLWVQNGVLTSSGGTAPYDGPAVDNIRIEGNYFDLGWYLLPTVRIYVTGNRLTANQASLETDTTGWAAGANTTIARSTAQALDGVASLSMTSGAAGQIYAQTPLGAAGVPIAPSTVITGLANFRAATVARTCQVQLVWYQASGAASAVRAYDTSGAVVDTTTGWTQVALTVTSPSDAAFAAIQVIVPATGAAGEVYYVDEISIADGSSTVWGRGGGTVTYGGTPSSSLTDTAANFVTDGVAVLDTVRVMPVITSGTSTSVTPTSLTDTGASFSAATMRKGQIIRTGGLFAVVAAVQSATAVQVEAWWHDTTRAVVGYPALGAYTVYDVYVANVQALTATTLTLNTGVHNLDGVYMTVAAGTRYEMLRHHPSYPINLDIAARHCKISDNTVRRGWSDQISTYGIDTTIVNNTVEWGQDEGITLSGQGHLVVGNRVRHQGSGNIFAGCADSVFVGNNLTEWQWTNGDTVNAGSIEIQGQTGNIISGNRIKASAAQISTYGITVESNSNTIADNIITGPGLTAGIRIFAGVTGTKLGLNDATVSDLGTGTLYTAATPYGHATTSPTSAPLAAIGGTPPAITVTGTDASHTLSFGTGTAPAAGAIFSVTFATPYAATPRIILGATPSIQGFNISFGSKTTTGYQVFTGPAAPPASQVTGTYTFDVVVTP